MLVEWFVIIGIIVLIILFFIAFAYNRRAAQPSNLPTNEFVNPIIWSSPVPVSNPSPTLRGQCAVYEFDGAMNGSTLIPGTPSFNADILDQITPQAIPSSVTCFDPDQLIAQEVTHTCITPSGVTIASPINVCPLLTGGYANLGQTETYYSNVNCTNYTACAGQLAIIALNYIVPDVPISQTYCLANNTSINQVDMALCDPTDPLQQFRVTRLNPGQNPSNLQNGKYQNGILAQFLDRSSGLCIVPPSTTPNPGDGLVLGNCAANTPASTGLAAGYLWGLIPTTTYTPSNQIPTVVPQQIVYLGNIDFTGFDFQTATMNDLLNLLVSQNALSMTSGSGGFFSLQPFCIDINEGGDIYLAQYINYSLYNIISTEPICGVGLPGTCYSF